MRQHLHRFQWFYLTFLLIIFVGLGFFYVIRSGHYPVAVVNGGMVSARSLNSEYAVAFRYYAATLSNQQEIDINSRDFRKELRRAALQDLIEKTLVSRTLEEKIGKDLPGIIQNKLSGQKANDQSIEEAANMVYGLTLAEFTDLILVPQAQKEILEGRLFLEKKEFKDWLLEAARGAKVFIVTPEFYWENGELKTR